MLNIYIYGAGEQNPVPIVTKCATLILSAERYRIVPNLDEADIAIAPLLTRMLSLQEIFAPKIGTLVFHPSLLPRHRGPDAIKWAFKLGETYTGATWFWPDEGIDTGDICEQEVLAIPPEASPRDFYEYYVIPAALRTLSRAIDDIAAGRPRRVPQQNENATYETRIKRRGR